MTRARTRQLSLIFSVAFVALAVLSACMTDHDALEKKPNQAAGAGGVAGMAGAGHVPVSGSGGVLAAGGHADDEAPGASLLTIVNGVVDAPRVVLCFGKVGSDGALVPFGDPLTKAPLGYGQSVALAAIPGADPAADVLQPILIAGQLALVSGLDCRSAFQLARTEEAAVSPPSELGLGGSPGEAGTGGAAGAAGAVGEIQARLRVRALAAISPDTLNGWRSYLLALSGCLGGSGYDAAKAEDYCGTGYTEQSPTVSGIFASLSRATSAGHVGLQVLQGSLATDPVSVSSRPRTPAEETISIVTGDVYGGLLPRPAYIDHTAFDYGSARGYQLDIAAQRRIPTQTGSKEETMTLLTVGWSDVLALGGLPALVDGENYALVLIGPLADSEPSAEFWNRPAMTVVPVDPK